MGYRVHPLFDISMEFLNVPVFEGHEFVGINPSVTWCEEKSKETVASKMDEPAETATEWPLSSTYGLS